MDAKTVERDPIRVAYVRHIGPYELIETAWQEICAWAGAKGLLGPDTQMIGLSYDDPADTPPERIRYDACIPVADEVHPEGNIGVQIIPGGRYATTIMQGPYTGMRDCYATLIEQWMSSHGLEMLADRPGLEIYLNDASQTPETELLTAIYVPLA